MIGAGIDIVAEMKRRQRGSISAHQGANHLVSIQITPDIIMIVHPSDPRSSLLSESRMAYEFLGSFNGSQNA